MVPESASTLKKLKGLIPQLILRPSRLKYNPLQSMLLLNGNHGSGLLIKGYSFEWGEPRELKMVKWMAAQHATTVVLCIKILNARVASTLPYIVIGAAYKFSWCVYEVYHICWDCFKHSTTLQVIKLGPAMHLHLTSKWKIAHSLNCFSRSLVYSESFYTSDIDKAPLSTN